MFTPVVVFSNSTSKPFEAIQALHEKWVFDWREDLIDGVDFEDYLTKFDNCNEKINFDRKDCCSNLLLQLPGEISPFRPSLQIRKIENKKLANNLIGYALQQGVDIPLLMSDDCDIKSLQGMAEVILSKLGHIDAGVLFNKEWMKLAELSRISIWFSRPDWDFDYNSLIVCRDVEILSSVRDALLSSGVRLVDGRAQAFQYFKMNPMIDTFYLPSMPEFESSLYI